MSEQSSPPEAQPPRCPTTHPAFAHGQCVYRPGHPGRCSMEAPTWEPWHWQHEPLPPFDPEDEPVPPPTREAVGRDDGEVIEDETAEQYIARLRGPLLHYFGTTDPDLLAEVWSDASLRSAAPTHEDSKGPCAPFRTPSPSPETPLLSEQPKVLRSDYPTAPSPETPTCVCETLQPAVCPIHGELLYRASPPSAPRELDTISNRLLGEVAELLDRKGSHGSAMYVRDVAGELVRLRSRLSAAEARAAAAAQREDIAKRLLDKAHEGNTIMARKLDEARARLASLLEKVEQLPRFRPPKANEQGPMQADRDGAYLSRFAVRSLLAPSEDPRP